MSASVGNLMSHVARGTTTSPFVSLSRSFGVAKDYAIDASAALPTVTRPAYVYEIDIDPSHGLEVIDPLYEVSRLFKNPLTPSSYHHDGSQSFILGVVDPARMAAYLSAPAPQPSLTSGGTSRPPNLTIELETMVRALRDAEILVVGAVPSVCVVTRFPEY